MSRNAKITVQIWKLNTNKMAEHNELGKLEKKKWRSISSEDGYTILETNWTFQKQKLISLPKENTLAVVEVKTRSSLSLVYKIL
jgi:Holliday junction resolvase-like predicted endonuclease